MDLNGKSTFPLFFYLTLRELREYAIWSTEDLVGEVCSSDNEYTGISWISKFVDTKPSDWPVVGTGYDAIARDSWTKGW